MTPNAAGLTHQYGGHQYGLTIGTSSQPPGGAVKCEQLGERIPLACGAGRA
jgi:hypothetical protein